jgi:hypothetical protein
MDLHLKDTNELENIRADELVGSNPSFKYSLMNEDDEYKRSENINRFVSWMFIYDECKKKFNEHHTLIWSEMYQNKHRNWLEYYKGVLIEDIRDIKLKKLLK